MKNAIVTSLAMVVIVSVILSISLIGCAMHKGSMAEIHYANGVDALKAREHQRAVKYFTLAINESPEEKGQYFNESAAYVNRGMAFAEMADFQQAEQDFTSALEQNPGNPVAYQNRGFIRAKMKHYTEAKEDLDKAIELSPSYAQAYFSRAQLHDVQNDRNNALQDYKTALQLMRQQGQGHSEYAIHIERKIAEYERSVSFDADKEAQSSATKTKNYSNAELGVSFPVPKGLVLYTPDNPGPLSSLFTPGQFIYLVNPDFHDENIGATFSSGVTEKDLSNFKKLMDTNPPTASLPGYKKISVKFIKIGRQIDKLAVEHVFTMKGNMSGTVRQVVFIHKRRAFSFTCATAQNRYEQANSRFYGPIFSNIEFK